ncbi:MAG TPA: MASE1 domain-containing protein [Vicinamibacterales bacterium]|jgi:PAS domain S-box-containing protein
MSLKAVRVARVLAPQNEALRRMAAGAAVALAYVIAAEIGFRVAFVAEQVTTVWAPTGIALATLLLGGRRYWPAIWLGAFVVNAATNAPPWTAAIIASGNTLEALVAARALGRLPSFDPGLRRIADILAFVGIAVVLATAVSATVGVVTLCAAGVQPWPRFTALWFDWWLGDALGALIVTPAILTIARCASWRRDAATILAFAAGTMILTHLVFGRLLGPTAHPLEYVVFPVVIAAAVTGGLPATTLAVLGASAVAIWNTLRGAGPFAGGSAHQSLILLQTFMGVLSATALLLAAAIAEREGSERREQEAARVLRDRDELLRLAQRSGGVATFAWDFQNQIAQCSAEFFRIFGVPGQDGGEMAVREWAAFVHPADRERMAGHLARALERREPAVADYRIVLRDGTVRWLSYAGRLEQTAEGDRMLGTVLDITARKQAEIVLEEAKIAAESANQLKDQFLATLSHELRTPLNAILGYTRMLRTNTIAADKREHALEVIERNASAQNQLVEDLLDMSRITTGRVRLEVEPIAVAAVLRDAIEGIRPGAEAKRIVLDVDLDPAGGNVTADRTRLQQVFWNVLTNAVKFTGVEGRVAVTLRRDGGHVEIAVRDSGAGIAADFLPFLFEPFRQADARLARGHGGLGLGLAISKQLVELHGGTIQASSAGEGQGSMFVIRLPRREDAEPAPHQLAG